MEERINRFSFLGLQKEILIFVNLQVKCWDLEYNKVIRHYHGHLSAVQALSVHPTLDVLVTCSRDSTARVILVFFCFFLS